MPHKGVVNNPNGRKRIWDSPEALWADFELYLQEQAPHIIKVLDGVGTIKPGHENFDPPCEDDYDWSIEEVEDLSVQKPLTITSFAVWKGVHRTTITTGYSEDEFKQAYARILGQCEAYAETQLFNSKRNVSGIIFILKNCYGWSDKPKPDRSGDIDVPLSPEGKAILDKALSR
jgi:hypothetical protein